MAKSKKTIKAAALRIGVAAKKKVVRRTGLAAVNENIMLPESTLDKKQASKGLTRKKPALKKVAVPKSLAKKNDKSAETEATELEE